MFRIDWDSEDYRFNYFDGTYWNNLNNAIERIKEMCVMHMNNLMEAMSDDDYEDFPSWVDWCIESFLYIEEIKFEDA